MAFFWIIVGACPPNGRISINIRHPHVRSSNSILFHFKRAVWLYICPLHYCSRAVAITKSNTMAKLMSDQSGQVCCTHPVQHVFPYEKTEGSPSPGFHYSRIVLLSRRVKPGSFSNYDVNAIGWLDPVHSIKVIVCFIPTCISGVIPHLHPLAGRRPQSLIRNSASFCRRICPRITR